LTGAAARGFDPRVELRAILFDYGGTLDGPASHWLDRMVGLLREAAVDRPYERIKAAFYAADDAAYAEPAVGTMSLAELMDFHVGRQLAGLGIDDRTLHDHLAGEFVRRSSAALTASRAALNRLAPRYRLGVVSNFYGNVARILADADIAPLLTVIADSTRVGVMKPDRRIFEHALAALEAAPQQVLHVGDSYERDVCAARALGLRTAWLVADHRRAASRDAAAADLVICSLDELDEKLELGRTTAPSTER
jgi:putative hydrolase of the HAD superfamily